ncbi:MAG: SlyX family protein [Alphaproteobacteria bacterium]|nr:SlyX family protein [Alphaproteobacteria bacterium]
MSDDRLNDIETRLAYLDMQFDEMNGVILEQATMIRHLKAKISRLEVQNEDEDSGDRGLSPSEIAARDKPPHY